MNFDLIPSGKIIIGVLEIFFHKGVICDQKQSFRVIVESAYSHKMAIVFEVVFWEEFVNCLSALRIFSGTDTISRFVDHPKFGYGFLLFDSQFSKGFHLGVVGYKHILEDTFAVNSDKTQLNDILGLST